MSPLAVGALHKSSNHFEEKKSPALYFLIYLEMFLLCGYRQIWVESKQLHGQISLTQSTMAKKIVVTNRIQKYLRVNIVIGCFTLFNLFKDFETCLN